MPEEIRSFDGALPAWDIPRVPAAKKMIPIVRPKPGTPFTFIVLSETMLSLNKHYMPRRTIPCTGIRETCEGCQGKLPFRWYGYLACCGAMDRLLCIAEVTGGAADSCPTLTNKKVNLRGSRLTLRRRGQAANSPILAELLPGRDAANIPACFDLKEQLLLIWGIGTIRERTDNHNRAAEDFQRQSREADFD